MKFQKTWLGKNLNLLVIITACILVFCFFQKEEKYINEYNAKIEALEQKVDSLHHLNDELTFEIDTLNVEIGKLDKELDLKDNRINNLRYEISTKVDAVDNFNDNELEKFFTERYRQYFDSIKKANSQTSN
jgi:peptidoglycan hydrolase CwlO-like protein|tara:strand:- start:614 stop:1006 length:393 start_codon:yes stop_codon:yes gene_type:complete